MKGMIALSVALAFVGVIGMTHPAHSQSSPEMSMAPSAKAESVTGKVTDIDSSKRKIEVQSTDGKSESYQIDPAVSSTSLDQIKKGDKVRLEVAEKNGSQVATKVEKAG